MSQIVMIRLNDSDIADLFLLANSEKATLEELARKLIRAGLKAKTKPVLHLRLMSLEGPGKPDVFIPIVQYQDNEYFFWHQSADKTWNLSHKPTGWLIYKSRSKIVIEGLANSLNSLGEIWNFNDRDFLKERPELLEQYQAILNYWRAEEE